MMRDSLPTGWASCPLASVVDETGVFTDGDWVESKDQDPNGEVRLIQLADVGDGSYRDRSARFLTLEKARGLRCTFLKQGDVLVSRMADPLGRACLFPGDPKTSCTVVDVCIIRPGRQGVDARWLVGAINSPSFRELVSAEASGTTRKRISRKNLGVIDVPVPPLNEQRCIVAKIEELFDRSHRAREHLDRIPALIDRLRKSILAAAFRGDLTKDWREANPSCVRKWKSVSLDSVATDVQYGSSKKSSTTGRVPVLSTPFLKYDDVF